MSSGLTVAIDPDLSEDDHEALLDSLLATTERAAPHRHYDLLAVSLRDDAGKLCGGLLGSTLWNWLQVEILWVEESLRGNGLGADLLRTAEREAVSRGCDSAKLDTFDFEARGFYEKQGYEVYAQLDGFPAGHTQFHLKKSLV